MYSPIVYLKFPENYQMYDYLNIEQLQSMFSQRRSITQMKVQEYFHRSILFFAF